MPRSSTFAIGAKSRVFLILNNLRLVNPIRGNKIYNFIKIGTSPPQLTYTLK